MALTAEQERELHEQLARLLQEHRDLDTAIEALQDAPGSDVLQVQRLKKRKLYLRDRISFIEDQLTPDIWGDGPALSRAERRLEDYPSP
jgi:hypothetical protein